MKAFIDDEMRDLVRQYLKLAAPGAPNAGDVVEALCSWLACVGAVLVIAQEARPGPYLEAVQELAELVTTCQGVTLAEVIAEA